MSGEAWADRRRRTMADIPRSVRLVEVGPRDGLQNEADLVPSEAKIGFVDALSRSGLVDIEVTSFVNPRAVPQLADAVEVLTGIEKYPGIRYWVLIPNIRGLERWLELAGVLDPGQWGIALFTAASETFNRKNVNAGINESLENFRAVIDRLRRETGSRPPFLRGYISTAVRCPYEGPIAPKRVLDVGQRLFDLGVDEVSLGDTIGAATPADIARLLETVLPNLAIDRLALHAHDTRGTALANVLVALDYGIHIFDSSAGGLGGCPFAPGASGNLATEDLLYMLNGLKIETGVDIAAVVLASEVISPFIAAGLPGKELKAFRTAGF